MTCAIFLKVPWKKIGGLLVFLYLVFAVAYARAISFENHKGVYILFASGQQKRSTITDKNFLDIVSNPAKRDLIEGVTYKVGWGWIEPAPGTYEWDSLIQEIKHILSYRKSDSEPLKLYLHLNISNLPPWLTQSPYNVPLFYYKQTVRNPDGSLASFTDGITPIPWNPLYLDRIKIFTTNLRNALKANLTPEEYDLIVQIGINEPGSISDGYRIPTGKELTSLETRPEITQCNSSQSFYHDYDKEWIDPCFTANDPYLVTGVDNYEQNKLYRAYRTINDHLTTTFNDKFIIRVIQMADPVSAPTNSTSRDILDMLALIAKDAAIRHAGRYFLQVDGLRGGPNPPGYYALNLIETLRNEHGALISLETVSGSDNEARFQGTLREALETGLARGALAFTLYNSELIGSLDPANPAYNQNMQAHMDDLGFLQSEYARDTAPPSPPVNVRVL